MISLVNKIDALLSNSTVQKLHVPEFFGEYDISIAREDLIHPEISGNKLRKLKYNLLEAERLGKKQILTFGGAYSNHIAATAAAGREFGFETIGIIRGEELSADSNETLKKASEDGMRLHFWSRSDYKMRSDKQLLLRLETDFPDAWLIPEGGANFLGIQGCGEIISGLSNLGSYTHILTPCGTATTLVGLICKLQKHQKAIGISVLKENFLNQAVENQLACMPSVYGSWEINSTQVGQGYAQADGQLIEFIGRFFELSGIFAEPVYTGKMLLALQQLCQEYYFPTASKILVIHTGGLQGWNGFTGLNPFKRDFNQG